MLIYGKDTADDILAKTQIVAGDMRRQGLTPTLALLRLGARPDDIAYERSITRVALRTGVRVLTQEIPEEATTAQLLTVIRGASSNPDIHGIMLFRPLPEHIDENLALGAVAPYKDVDGSTDSSLAWIYALSSGVVQEISEAGFAPCTATAALMMLLVHGESLKGKKAVVVGRSLVIGKPAAMLLLAHDATVTITHSKTENLASVTREADIVVVCAGLAGGNRSARLGAEYFRAGQLIIDCGINADADGLYGDVDTAAVDALGAAVTPVPGGLGAVTTAVLMENVVRAADCARLLRTPETTLKC